MEKNKICCNEALNSWIVSCSAFPDKQRMKVGIEHLRKIQYHNDKGNSPNFFEQIAERIVSMSQTGKPGKTEIQNDTKPKKVLFINACVRPNSRTRILAQEVLNKLDGQIEEVNLEQERISPLDWESLQIRDQQEAKGDFSHPMFGYAKQFAQADEIVIAAPYWELTFPAMVRIYFEVVSVVGITFGYTPQGAPLGLCKAKRIIYVTTSGGEIGKYNLGYDFVKALSDCFYGIPKTLCFSAEKLDIKGMDVEKIMEEAKKEIWQTDL